jgi:hypothetical protein
MIKSHSFWRKQFGQHILALIIYALVTGLALNRLMIHFGDAVPDDGIHHDYAIFCWDMWWMRHALVEMQTVF